MKLLLLIMIFISTSVKADHACTPAQDVMKSSTHKDELPKKEKKKHKKYNGTKIPDQKK